MNKIENIIHVFTDGSCDPNPGKGGWAAVILNNGREDTMVGSEDFTTNNRMELAAALNALKRMTLEKPVHVHTDSQYLQKGITEWLPQWKSRGWKRKGGVLANLDLWQELDAQLSRLNITWHWVRGHAGNKYNEKANWLAQAQIRK